MRNAPYLLLLVLVLASCAKDEVVTPGTVQAPAAVVVSNKGNTTFDKDGSTDPTVPDSGTISDDGDDINDGEGRRKKKKP
jgi:hypothetical protein